MALAYGGEMGEGEGPEGLVAGAAGNNKKAWIQESASEWEEGEKGGGSVRGRGSAA